MVLKLSRNNTAIDSSFLWYRDKESLKIGQISRYTITYSKSANDSRSVLHLRITNVENVGVRMVHLLSGPFIFYCHVVPCNYDHHKPLQTFGSDDNIDIKYDNTVKPGQSFKAVLKMNETSKLYGDREVYRWTVDICSQIVISERTEVTYDFMIGTNKKALKKVRKHFGEEDFKLNESFNVLLDVEKQNTNQLWDVAPPYPDKPVHLVFLTHGIFSNLTADMFYLKERIEYTANNSNVLVRGYTGNAGHTERGVAKLGKAMAQYIVQFLNETTFQIDKISFIGHSLGGLIQTYAIKYLLSYHSHIFDSIVPINFITLASPYLGILNERSLFISLFLDIGTLGKTGRDLTLCRKLPSLKDIQNQRESNKSHTNVNDPLNAHTYRFKPLLEMLPLEPLHQFLAKFRNLALYANAINDGIVPLRTSALLYLDWSAISDVNLLSTNETSGDFGVRDTNNQELGPGSRKTKSLSDTEKKEEFLKSSSTNSNSVREIPDTKRHALNQNKIGKLVDLNLNGHTDSHRPRLSRRQRSLIKMHAKSTDISEFKHGATQKSATPTDSTGSLSTTQEYDDEDIKSFRVPPRASAIESAINTLICPLPTQKFLVDPDSRENPIFHDRFYDFDNIAPPFELGFFDKLKSFVTNEKLHTQIKIARAYHDGLSWRKILVKLPPDAHNNIIVRRRFSNAYGWGVVDHLCAEFFSDVAAVSDEQYVKDTTENSDDTT